jgi:hypothetical protein
MFFYTTLLNTVQNRHYYRFFILGPSKLLTIVEEVFFSWVLSQGGLELFDTRGYLDKIHLKMLKDYT